MDLTFDCTRDANGRDPDSHSPTLRRLHQFFWSKELPSGRSLSLDIAGPKPFLVHQSDLGEFHLSSDSITHSYRNRSWAQPFLESLPESLQERVSGWGWFISECIVFPGKRINGMTTINGARGMNAVIGDRFDLTLECIRRHYQGEPNPLDAALLRYGKFFELFEDFEGYVNFFLLNDLVDKRSGGVRFYLPFDNFLGSPYPHDAETYNIYLQRTMDFSKGRLARMMAWAATNCADEAKLTE